jgi:hypothetical protein
VERSRRLVDRALGNAQESVDLAHAGLVSEIFEPRAGVLENLATDGVFEPEEHAAEPEQRLGATRGITELVERARSGLEALASLLEEPACEERFGGLEGIPGEGTTLLYGQHLDDLTLPARRLEP